ncbi:Flp pilus assembly complex ATPase component TadA [bacterium]|nr:Flp pilus assembly complex ATPase component TadA [bacterium]
MFVKDQKKFEQLLTQMKIVTPAQLESAKVESIKTNKSLEDVLSEKKIVTDEDITKTKSLSSGIPYIKLLSIRIDPKVLKQLDKDYCGKHNLIPFELLDAQIKVAMIDPYDVQAIDYIEKKTGLMVIPYIASKASIDFAISQYQDYESEMEDALKSIDSGGAEVDNKKTEANKDEVEKIVQDAPITRAVNTILDYAVKLHASDIHIEPEEKDIIVRYRIDGMLQEYMKMPKSVHPALISRIKILSNLKIDEHRVPQDGRFDVQVAGLDVDLRVSMSPTIHGEKVVIRLLDKSSTIITLDQLGLKGNAFKLLEEGSKEPWGMILSTGPTGSGKSTTLYALLTKMNKVEVNIITLEDPVEYEVNGINQIQINAKVGLTFAAGLRSVLRQDPDIIMVGEIRDKETADLAVQSALTGHVVLSTLHTNSAAGVLPRMLDMEIEPFLISSTVNTVIGQRLVRKVCEKCKESYDATKTEIDAIKEALKKWLPNKNDSKAKEKFEYLGFDGLPYLDDQKMTLYKGKGCDNCRNTGYSGRLGIFEVFKVTEDMGKLLLQHATSNAVEELAVSQGMVTMKQDGFVKALSGVTTLQEVARVTRV